MRFDWTKEGLRRFGMLFIGLLFLTGLSLGDMAQAKPNPQDPPPKFVQEVADELLVVLKSDPEVRKQNLNRINAIVEQYIMPYVDFERTTRLAAGKYWREASEQQKKDLSEAFKLTLIRTYSGALTRVDNGTSMEILPFRDEPGAKDVVVRSHVVQGTNMQPIKIDYRLRLTPEGWRIYDLNVENVWLIQNYRNQFAQQISQSGIDGLIVALNERNTKN